MDEGARDNVVVARVPGGAREGRSESHWLWAFLIGGPAGARLKTFGLNLLLGLQDWLVRSLSFIRLTRLPRRGVTIHIAEVDLGSYQLVLPQVVDGQQWTIL